jgi:ribosomal protein L37AE/L43A
MVQTGTSDVPSHCAQCGIVTLHRQAPEGGYHCMRCVMAASTPPLAQQVSPRDEQLSRCPQCETTTIHVANNGTLVCKRCLERGAVGGLAPHHLLMQKVGWWLCVALTIFFVLAGVAYCG